MCYCPTPTLHLNLALTGDGAFLLSPQKTHSVWLISILNYGDTENVLINHLLLVIPMSYPCHYTNLCPHKPHKHAHTHTHTHTHTLSKVSDQLNFLSIPVQYSCFYCILKRRVFFQKTLKRSYQPQTFEWQCAKNFSQWIVLLKYYYFIIGVAELDSALDYCIWFIWFWADLLINQWILQEHQYLNVKREILLFLNQMPNAKA